MTGFKDDGIGWSAWPKLETKWLSPSKKVSRD